MACESFAKQWEFVEIDACFLISESDLKSHLEKLFPILDMMIYQPVSEAHRGEIFSTKFIREQLPDSTVVVSFPYLHWEGYYPLSNTPYGLLPHPDGYVDVLIGAAVSLNIGLDFLIKRQEIIGVALSQDINAIESWCASELSTREGGDNDGGRPLDICITDYIVDNWRTKLLFYTMNHPTHNLLKEIAGCCMKGLGYNQNEIFFSDRVDPLDLTQLAFYNRYIDNFKFGNSSLVTSTQILFNRFEYTDYVNNMYTWFTQYTTDELLGFVDRLKSSRPWINHAIIALSSTTL